MLSYLMFKRVIERFLSLFFIYQSSPFFPALTAFSFLPPVPPVSPVPLVPPVALVPPVSPVALVPPVPFLPAFPAFPLLPYTNLKRTISEPSAKDERRMSEQPPIFLSSSSLLKFCVFCSRKPLKLIIFQ